MRHTQYPPVLPGPVKPEHPFPIRTICGSMRYYDQMIEIAQRETANGVIILMPSVAGYATDDYQHLNRAQLDAAVESGDPNAIAENDRREGAVEADERKEMLDRMHFAKIDMSDAIIVVGIHIGESTQSEIAYAERTGKTVLYWTLHFGAIE